MNLPFTYLTGDEVMSAIGVRSKSRLYALMKRDDLPLPEPDRLSTRCTRWRSDRIACWLEQVAARADAERAERTRIAVEKSAWLNQQPRLTKEEKAAREQAAA